MLDGKCSYKTFDAFQVEDEDFEKRVIRVGMGEHDNLVQIGRIKIKNRVKTFNVTVTKSEPVKNATFKILISMDD